MLETSESAELSFPDSVVTPLNALGRHNFVTEVVSIGTECSAPLAMNLSLMVSSAKHDTDPPAPSDSYGMVNPSDPTMGSELEHASVLRCKNRVALESPF